MNNIKTNVTLTNYDDWFLQSKNIIAKTVMNRYDADDAIVDTSATLTCLSIKIIENLQLSAL